MIDSPSLADGAPMNIAVVVATYSNPSALQRVLDGLRHQTRLPDEVVVADDGSGEETRLVVEEFAASAPFRVEHAWHENRGFRAAAVRNLGIRSTRSAYIVCLDGDCLPAKRFVEDHLRVAEKGCFYVGRRVLVDRDRSTSFDHRDANSVWRRLRLLTTGQLSCAQHMLRLPFLPARRSVSRKSVRTSNFAFFREDIYAVNGFNEGFVGWGREDSELAERFFKYGLRRKDQRFLALCFHLWHESNDMSRLQTNDALLQKTLDSPAYFCVNGLVNESREV